MFGDDLSNINPGEALQKFLKSLYPLDLPENGIEHKGTFIFSIDESLMANGAFASLVYESSINYLVRRWINTAQYLYKKLKEDDDELSLSDPRFSSKLRKFIKDNTALETNDVDIDKLQVLLQNCLKVRNKPKKSRKWKKNLRRRITNKALAENNNQSLKCYICGRFLEEQENDFNFEENEDDFSFEENGKESKELTMEIEHIWPESMGGVTQDFNLQISCNECNKMKRDYLDSTDFHYEKMSFAFLENKIPKIDKIALWSKSQYSCSVCQKPAASIGTLNLGRINPDDSWHFLNIEAYCDEHTPE